jgi:hypothetical protein
LAGHGLVDMPAADSVLGGGFAVARIDSVLTVRRIYGVFPQSTSACDAGLFCWTVDLMLSLTSQRCRSCIESAEYAAGLGPVSSPFSVAALDWRHRLDIDFGSCYPEVRVKSLPRTSPDIARCAVSAPGVHVRDADAHGVTAPRRTLAYRRPWSARHCADDWSGWNGQITITTAASATCGDPAHVLHSVPNTTFHQKVAQRQ